MRRKLVTGIALLLWEAWWGYVYFSAPVPDERMDTILALVMGVAIPIWLALVVMMIFWLKRSARSD